MEIPIAIRVPDQDIDALRELQEEVGSSDEIVIAHPFDGETVAQLFIVLSGASYPFFRSWLSSRAASRKSYSVVHNGTELSGYTADEVGNILKRLERAAPMIDAPEKSIDGKKKPRK